MKLLRKNYAEKSISSLKAAALLSKSDFYRRAQKICCYNSAFGEVDTKAIISDAISHKKKVCVPISHEDGTLSLSLTDGAFKKGLFDIDEPKNPVFVDFSYPDLIIVPGLAFDKKGGRIGFGKGYYDRFLASAQGLKVGLCYSFQLLSSLPTEEHDVHLDALVTEKEILFFN